MLEPELYDTTVCVLSASRTTKAGKAAAAEAEANGQIILSAADHDLVMAMAQSVTRHSAASELLAQGSAECSFFRDEQGLQFRCRPDWL